MDPVDSMGIPSEWKASAECMGIGTGKEMVDRK